MEVGSEMRRCVRRSLRVRSFSLVCGAALVLGLGPGRVCVCVCVFVFVFVCVRVRNRECKTVRPSKGAVKRERWTLGWKMRAKRLHARTRP